MYSFFATYNRFFVWKQHSGTSESSDRQKISSGGVIRNYNKADLTHPATRVKKKPPPRQQRASHWYLIRPQSNAYACDSSDAYASDESHAYASDWGLIDVKSFAFANWANSWTVQKLSKENRRQQHPKTCNIQVFVNSEVKMWHMWCIGDFLFGKGGFY